MYIYREIVENIQQKLNWVSQRLENLFSLQIWIFYNQNAILLLGKKKAQ